MSDIVSSPQLDGRDLDEAIEHARAALAALVGVPGDGDGATCYPEVIAEARALLGALLEHRITQAAARLDERNDVAVAAVRADRNEAIAVAGALLYWLPADDPAWPEVALTLGRLSYDRYSDPWPGADPPDPDDLDAACDLLLRGAHYDDADERTTLYLFLALRDRQHLMALPADAQALMTWGERLRAFPDAGGLGESDLQDMLELELLGRADAAEQADAQEQADARHRVGCLAQTGFRAGSPVRTGSLVRAGSPAQAGPWAMRPARLVATLI
jgi:hypothetical protein